MTVCPGLEAALPAVWWNAPEELSQLFQHLEVPAQACIRTALLALHRGEGFRALRDERDAATARADQAESDRATLLAEHGAAVDAARKKRQAVFGGLDITVDPYTQAGTGQVVLTANQYLEIACRQPASFAVMTDAKTA